MASAPKLEFAQALCWHDSLGVKGQKREQRPSNDSTSMCHKTEFQMARERT